MHLLKATVVFLSFIAHGILWIIIDVCCEQRGGYLRILIDDGRMHPFEISDQMLT